MFILIMQFFWKYIDDVMGKGIPVYIILELLFFVSVSLIPLALPLAILLSSIMTMGNMAENNELTALKSSGLSLYRILRPLIIVVLLLAAGTFYCANYLIPVANLKWHSIIYDVQNTKISALLTPGAYTRELEGYAIKVDDLQGDSFTNIIIHDHTGNNELKTIRAKSGRMYRSDNGKYMFFELKQGTVVEELSAQAPIFDGTGNIIKGKNSNRPARRSSFETCVYKIDVSGFTFEKSDDELFGNDYEMLNVFQLSDAKDSLQKKSDKAMVNYGMGHVQDDLYYQSLKYDSTIAQVSQKEGYRDLSLPARELNWSHFNSNEQKDAIAFVQSKLRQKLDAIKSQKQYYDILNRSLREYDIESHRKFALTYAVIVLFFVGAPLGAIVRKGGFGAPVVIAALLFMLYFVLISTGESLARSEVVPAWFGMWFASFLLTPFAFWIMRAAANDAPLFVMDNWVRMFEKWKRKSKKEKTEPRSKHANSPSH
jgi:lipopolysaccharide export system permease protein